MPKLIEGPDGKVIEFPDGMSDDAISRAMRTEYREPESVGGVLWRNLKATPGRMVEQITSDVRGAAETLQKPKLGAVLPFVVGPGVAAPLAAHVAGRMIDTPPTVGDVTGVIGETYRGGGQFVGSTAGSIVGQRYGGVKGAVVGAGVGGGAGRLIDVYRAYLRGDPIPTSVAADAFKAAGISAAFEAGGRALVGGAESVVKSIAVTPRPDAARVLEAFKATEVTPKVTDITASRAPAVMERAVAQTFTGQSGISEAVSTQARQVTAAADDYFMAKLFPHTAVEGVEAGSRVRAAVERSVERSKGVENQLFDDVIRLGEGVRVPLATTFEAAERLLGTELGRPAGLRSGKLISSLRDIVATRQQSVDVGQAVTIPLGKARLWAQTFGSAVERGELISKTPTAEAKHMFASLMDDIERGIAASGKPELQAAFTSAREFATLRRDLFVDSAVSQIMRTDPEKVVGMLGAAGGPSAWRRLERAVIGVPGTVVPDVRNQEALNYVRRHVFEGVFARARDEQAKGIFGPIISGARLDRELKRLGPELLDAMLVPTQREALDNVLTVTKAIRAGETLASAAQSTTAQQAEAKALLALPGAALGGAAGYLAGGGAGWTAAGAGIGSTLSLLFTAPAMSKLLTSERAVQVLASPGFRQLAMDLRLGGRISAEAALALERLGATLLTDAVTDREAVEAR